jgi:hypothetical protein
MGRGGSDKPNKPDLRAAPLAVICGTCRYFEADTSVVGSCRRYAPHATDTRSRKPWPLVRVQDWCGEHLA